MKKVVRILLAILMVTCLALGVSACKSDCEKGNHDKYVKSETAATCTAAKVEHWACNNCDWTEDVTVGNPLGHDYTEAEWTPSATDAAKHQRTCVRTGCGYVDVANHTTGAATCPDCGKQLTGDPQPCVHPNKTKTETPAGCTTAKVEHWSCPDCDWTEDKTVGKSLGHDYEGQTWLADGDAHYQSCKRDGCEARNEHKAHFGAYITTDANNHYMQCSECDIKSEQGEHNHSNIVKINDNQHSVACSVCGKSFESADHVWTLNTDKSHDATCSEIGARAYDCACGAEKSEPVEKIPHTIKFVTTATTHKSVCSVCNETIIAETAHDELVWNNTDKDVHFKWCKTCEYIDETTRQAHEYGEGQLTCSVCERTPEGVIVATFYKGEYHRFDTLVEAVASITDSENAVIYLGQDLEGAGIFIPENRNINFRLQGNTYTVVSGAVGSVNYKSQAFHIEKNSNITIQNGTITSKSGSGVKMLVQNYANLTLMNNLTLDGTNLDADGDNLLYTLSNNFGSTTIRNTTIIAKTEKDVAFDVWYGMKSAYLSGVSVTLQENNTITGIIEYGSAVANTDWSKVALVMLTNRNRNIVFSSSNVTCDQANITYADGTKVLSHTISDAWSYENERHFHECARCHTHVDEEACTKVTIQGEKETCTTNGWTDGVKCSVCETIIVEREIIPAHHEFSDTLTAIDAIQHGYKCANCDMYDQSVTHTYVANHCAACGKEITEAEILAELAKLEADKYLAGKTSTFKLTGVITKVDYAYTENNGVTVTMTVGNTSIYCFKMRGSDVNVLKNLLVGDTITVVGSLTNFQGKTLEFDLGCTLESAKYGNVEITWTKEDNVTVEGLVNEAERLSSVEFSVLCADGYYVVVKVNGVEIDANDEGKYSFVADADTAVEIILQDANVTHPHKISDLKTATISNKDDKLISATAYASAESNYQTGGVVVNGVTFEYRTIITNTAKDTFQLNVTNNKNTDNPNAYMKVIVLNGYITRFALSGVTDTARKNLIVFGYDENGEEIKDLTVSAEDNLTIINIGKNKLKAIKFTSSGALTVNSIELTYGIEGECSNTTSFTEHPAQAPTCTEDGTIRYWTCDACGAKFDDEMCNNMITDIVDPATGHHVGNLVEAQAPNCVTETNGHVAYYQCSGCDKYFEDAEATKEIASITISYNHSLIKVDKVFPTSEAAGKEEYWKCSVDGCTACFEDEQGERKIEDIDTWGIIDPIADCSHENYVWKFDADKSHCKLCSTCGVEFDACDGMFENELMVEVTSKNNGNHDFTCVVCDLTLEDVSCVYDNNNVCILCDYRKNSEVTVTLTINDGLTGKVTIGANELGETGTISLVKGAEVNINAIFGDTEVTMTVFADDVEILDGKFTPTNDIHNITITVSKKVSETKVEKSSFSSTSGNLDENISYTTAKGGGTSAPAINGNEIRLYQNSSGTGGGTITIKAENGKTIKSIIIGSSMGTSIAYTTDSNTTKSEKQSITANGNATLTFESGVQSVTIYCMGTSSSSRLYVNYLSVTYA